MEILAQAIAMTMVGKFHRSSVIQANDLVTLSGEAATLSLLANEYDLAVIVIFEADSHRPLASALLVSLTLYSAAGLFLGAYKVRNVRKWMGARLTTMRRKASRTCSSVMPSSGAGTSPYSGIGSGGRMPIYFSAAGKIASDSV